MRARSTHLLLLAALVQACAQGPAAPATPPPPPRTGPVAATVNGVPITESEVGLAKSAHGLAGTAEEQRAAAIEVLVRDELVRQRAMELGFDKEPGYVEEVGKAEAQLAGVKRRLLSDLWFKREVEKAAEVTDDEARQYFQVNAARFRTEYHVLQVMVRDATKAEELRKELQGGAKFAEVAARQFPNLPPGATPWDLGFLGFAQLPEAWKEVVPTLKPGETTPVLKGNKNRFWLVQLVEQRENASLDVDKLLPALKSTMKGARLEGARAKAEEALRANAKVVVLPAPAPAAPRPSKEN